METVRVGMEIVRGGMETVRVGMKTVKGGMEIVRGGMEIVRGGIKIVSEQVEASPWSVILCIRILPATIPPLASISPFSIQLSKLRRISSFWRTSA